MYIFRHKTYIFFSHNGKEFELNKTISFDEGKDDKQIDKFKIQNFRWPRITTANLMVSEKKELSKNEIEDTKKIIINTLSAHGVNTGEVFC